MYSDEQTDKALARIYADAMAEREAEIRPARPARRWRGLNAESAAGLLLALGCLLLAILLLVSVSGCRTVAGLGEDLHHAAEALSTDPDAELEPARPAR